MVAALFTVLPFWASSAAFYWLEPFVRSGWHFNKLVSIGTGFGGLVLSVLVGPFFFLPFGVFFAAFYLIPIILLSTLLEGFFGLMTLWRRPLPFIITVIVLVAIGFAWGFVDRVHVGNAPVSI